MGISGKILTGKSSNSGKPVAKAGPSQTAKVVTPKSKGVSGSKGG
jgi:hypothetical protein